MVNRRNILIVGSVLSFILLILFGVLQQVEAQFLTLSSQWILVALTPVIVALFVGGYITKFKGFGVELETALKTPVSTSVDLRVADALVDIPGDEKQSLNYLYNLPREKVLSIRRLVFESGRQGYYSPQGIREYLEKLPNLSYLEIWDKEGNFICYLPIEVFKSEVDHFAMEKINQFVRAIETGNVPSEFPQWAITLTVNSQNSLVEVLRTLRNEHVEMAAVISESGRYVGAIFSRDVERKVADAVLGSEKV